MTELHTFIEDMRSTSSANEKVEIIKNSSTFIHKVLEYTNDRIFKEKLDEKKIGIKPQPGSIKEP